MKKLNQAIDRFCILHPNFGIPNLMLYVVIGNVVLGLLSNFSNGNFLSFFSYTLSGRLGGEVWRLVAVVRGGGGRAGRRRRRAGGGSPCAGLAARHLRPHP